MGSVPRAIARVAQYATVHPALFRAHQSSRRRRCTTSDHISGQLSTPWRTVPSDDYGEQAIAELAIPNYHYLVRHAASTARSRSGAGPERGCAPWPLVA
jgi:hypothetical protein